MTHLKILLVVDADPSFSMLLQERPEYQVFKASNGQEAVQKADELHPDLILFDTDLPNVNVSATIRQIRASAPGARFILVGLEPGPDLVRETLRLKGQGCLYKQSAPTDLIPAIEAVLTGGRFVSSSVGFSIDTEELRSSLADIVESSQDAIVSRNLSGIIQSWNSGAQRIFGYTEKEAVGQPTTIIIPPRLRGEEREVLRRLQVGERIAHYETRRVTKDGRTIDVSITVSPIKDSEGRITGTAKIIRDITDRKRTEAALRESEERFRLAMHNVAAGLYTLDPQGLVTYMNPAAERMLGWKFADLRGRNIHEVIHYKYPDGTPFPAGACPALQTLQNGVAVQEREDTFIRRNGNFFPVVYSASPLKRGGKTVGMVVGFRDDTLRREAERAIRGSEERFRMVANAAPVMIWMSGLDKLCTYVNQGWLDFTGRSIEAELGSGWADAIHPEDLEGCLETYTVAFDERKPFQMEYRCRRHDGEERWLVSQGRPRFQADSSFAGYIGSVIDVTERKYAEQALSRMSQRLLEAQEDERRRIARELHDDISQQISLMLLGLERWRIHPSGPPEVREGIAGVIQQTANLGRDVRALSHRLHSSNLDYLGLAEAATGYCREISAQHKVQVHLQSENISTELSRDVALCLFRVLQEALQNAIKYSRTRHFYVSLIGRTGEIQLTVLDSGVGFSPEEAIKKGGLGLTSMRERLKLVDGKVSIESQLGKGTTVNARVPLRPKSGGQAAAVSPMQDGK
jgi:PAS domain S-box-containing protein